jgi:hypothetical protein
MFRHGPRRAFVPRIPRNGTAEPMASAVPFF